jgi:hypothetical protein
MRTPSELIALENAARSWVGTPFCERSALKGAGVCCHRLLLEVLVEAGWLPRIVVPDGSAGWAQAQQRGLIAEWMEGEGSRWFDSVSLCWTPDVFEAGDVIGFRLGRVVHHVALRLPDHQWLHAMQRVGVVIAPEIPAVWRKRAERCWRLKV